MRGQIDAVGDEEHSRRPGRSGSHSYPLGSGDWLIVDFQHHFILTRQKAWRQTRIHLTASVFGNRRKVAARLFALTEPYRAVGEAGAVRHTFDPDTDRG